MTLCRQAQSKAVCAQVDFEAVPDLVAQRKVFVHQGQAYIHRTEVASLVVGHFRYHFHKLLCCNEHQCCREGLQANTRKQIQHAVQAVGCQH